MKSDFSLIPMRVQYRGENSIEFSKYDKPVYYFSHEERLNSEIYIQNGRLLNHHHTPLTTNRSDHLLNEKPNIFIIDQNFKLLFHPQHQKRYIHHSSVVAGEPVRFAGSIIAENGQITEIIAHSGHYKPSLEQTLNALYWLQTQGLNLHSAYLSGPHIEEAFGVKSILISIILSTTDRSMNHVH
jgi:hypothetical protein